MKRILLSTLLAVSLYGDLGDIFSFEADFHQNIKDDKNKTLKYEGHVIAARPKFALWHYEKPIQKEIYITASQLTIIEPDLEQAIIKQLDNQFDIFSLIKHAKKIKKDEYLAHYKETTFIIKMKNDKISSISYKDEFDNDVTIEFTNQKQNKRIDIKKFIPVIPEDYDVIRG